MNPSPPSIIIPALKTELRPLLTASYCRVSSMLESQETSLTSQEIHFKELISTDPDLFFSGSYVDAGITGTKADTRPELQRLIEDCKAGKINLILTKSISRFSRNTEDCLGLVRLLSSLGISIHFEKENLFSSADGYASSDFLLSLLSWFAEYESGSISGNVKWSILRKYQKGTYKQAHVPYGYEWSNGLFVINVDEGEIVKEIFSSALSGIGTKKIADELNSRSLPSPWGKMWTQNSVRSILTNPFYTGDLLLQKTFIDASYCQVRNTGQKDQFLSEGHHEALVGKDAFTSATSVRPRRHKTANKTYPFTGLLICAECGSVMRRDSCNKERVTWICSKHKADSKACPMTPESEDDLKAAFINCLNKLAWSKILNKAVPSENTEILQIDEEIASIKKDLILVSAHALYDLSLPSEYYKFVARETALKKKRASLITRINPELTRLCNFINRWHVTDNPAAFPDDKMFRTLIKSCTVASNQSVTFHFICGLHLRESLEIMEEAISKIQEAAS